MVTMTKTGHRFFLGGGGAGTGTIVTAPDDTNVNDATELSDPSPAWQLSVERHIKTRNTFSHIDFIDTCQ